MTLASVAALSTVKISWSRGLTANAVTCRVAN